MAGRLPIYKTVLVGEGGVGKTSITLRYTEDRFDDAMKMTIGVNFASKKVTIGENNVTLMLWDLGGQPRFREVISDYFKGARIAIAVYDATRTFSLQRLSDWLGRVKDNAPDCQIIFVGNKIDERDDGSGVTLEEAAVMAREYGAGCMEVSAKTGEGVSEMFEAAAEIALTKHNELVSN
ncbi:MAG: GTP-binding protein [Candidatus Thorarchaeota archaeon]|nr:GTP-binding protein [Candidatus Thorarchaeota archaeon]